MVSAPFTSVYIRKHDQACLRRRRRRRARASRIMYVHTRTPAHTLTLTRTRKTQLRVHARLQSTHACTNTREQTLYHRHTHAHRQTRDIHMYMWVAAHRLHIFYLSIFTLTHQYTRELVERSRSSSVRGIHSPTSAELVPLDARVAANRDRDRSPRTRAAPHSCSPLRCASGPGLPCGGFHDDGGGGGDSTASPAIQPIRRVPAVVCSFERRDFSHQISRAL